jgi:hypothetical protein
MIHDDDTPNIYGDMPPSRFRFRFSRLSGNPYFECDCGCRFFMFTDDGDLMHDCALDRDPAYRCDWCGDHVPDGHGHYVEGDDDTRLCAECCADN